jgi:prevent-host-death family protein
MSRIGIADLKAHLSAHLRAVRSGEEIVVLDRDEPVATIVPYRSSGAAAIEIRPAADGGEPFGRLRPPKRRGRTNSLALLLEDRGRR